MKEKAKIFITPEGQIVLRTFGPDYAKSTHTTLGEKYPDVNWDEKD